MSSSSNNPDKKSDRASTAAAAAAPVLADAKSGGGSTAAAAAAAVLADAKSGGGSAAAAAAAPVLADAKSGGGSAAAAALADAKSGAGGVEVVGSFGGAAAAAASANGARGAVGTAAWAAAAGSVARATRKPMGDFDDDQKSGPGHHESRAWNVNNLLSERLGRNVTVRLSRPAVRGETFVVGTDDPNANEHYLILASVRGGIVGEGLRLKSHVQVESYVRDACWLSAERMLVSIGDGLIQVYAVDRSSMRCIVDGSGDSLHEDPVRELAISPFGEPLGLSGGFDKTLCLFDASRSVGREVRRYALRDVVGSVRWTAFKGASTATCTTDDGWLHAFDLRQEGDRASLTVNTEKPEMFAHEPYEDNYMLVGYDDGTVRNYDLRATNKPLSTTKDQYVNEIGNIHYRAAADPNQSSFVVTGCNGCSLWTACESERQKLWSNMETNRNRSTDEMPYVTTAAYFSDTCVVVSTSSGFVGLYEHQFRGASRSSGATPT